MGVTRQDCQCYAQQIWHCALLTSALQDWHLQNIQDMQRALGCDMTPPILNPAASAAAAVFHLLFLLLPLLLLSEAIWRCCTACCRPAGHAIVPVPT